MVLKYKTDKGLTWPELGRQLRVSDRELREKHEQPSPRTVAKLRAFFGGDPISPELHIPTIFTAGNHDKTGLRANGTDKTSNHEVKGEMSRRLTQPSLVINSDESQPPFPDDLAEALLTQHESIRDPIHKDIWITALERELIDTPAFQRLRNLKQLGPTYLVYPGAVHDRFLHSIGTMFCAEQIVDVVNHNYAIYRKPNLIKVGHYQHLLIRICALLHDLAHMPFGHTLGKEGNLRDDEWKDSKRVELWLGDKSEIVSKVISFVKNCGLSESQAQQFVQDIRRYVVPQDKSKQRAYPMTLQYPFIVDIVSNTLCADLLDYLERDTYYCGLRERSGDRVVKYLAIVRVKPSPGAEQPYTKFIETDDEVVGKGRIVLLSYRVERAHTPSGGSKTVPKSEIHSEAIDLLRRRYALAEKVYFHRTKIAASAMLISAAANASLEWDEVYRISDEAFLMILQGSSNLRARQLISKYTARKLYKSLYEIKYRPYNDGDTDSLNLYDELYPNYRKANWRSEKEKEIEDTSGLPPGSVSIYCPELGMNMKQFEMLVQNHPGDEIKPLKAIVDPTRQKEMAAINERFEQLWKLRILIDPEEVDVTVPSDRLYDISKICEEVMGFSNERTDLDLKGKGRPVNDQIAFRIINEFRGKHPDVTVPTTVFDELVTASRRAEGVNRIEQCRRHLEATMKSVK